MDFQIPIGRQRLKFCPTCNKKLLSVFTNGEQKLVCSCGWIKILQYKNEQINTKRIETR